MTFCLFVALVLSGVIIYLIFFYSDILGISDKLFSSIQLYDGN